MPTLLDRAVGIPKHASRSITGEENKGRQVWRPIGGDALVRRPVEAAKERPVDGGRGGSGACSGLTQGKAGCEQGEGRHDARNTRMTHCCRRRNHDRLMSFRFRVFGLCRTLYVSTVVELSTGGAPGGALPSKVVEPHPLDLVVLEERVDRLLSEGHALADVG